MDNFAVMKTERIGLKGVTRNVPDNVCAPGDLSVAMNVANDGAGLEPIEVPEEMFALEDGERLLARHQGSGYDNYITAGGSKLWCRASVAGEVGERAELATLNGDVVSLSVVGNTLVYNDDDGMSYLLWSDEEQGYKTLGHRPPVPKFQCSLVEGELSYYPPESVEHPPEIISDDFPYNLLTADEKLQFNKAGIGTYNVCRPAEEETTEGGQTVLLRDDGHPCFTLDLKDSYKSAVNDELMETVDRMTDYGMGMVGALVDEAHKAGRFAMPFFVRVCYELYDGHQWMHSYPVLMIPNSLPPQLLIDGVDDNDWYGFKVEKGSNQEGPLARYWLAARAYAFTSRLRLHCLMTNAEFTALRQWKDIVKGVGVYVSRPFYTYDQDEKIYGWDTLIDPITDEPREMGIYSNINVGRMSYDSATHTYEGVTYSEAGDEYRERSGFNPFMAFPTKYRPYIKGDETDYRPCYCLRVPAKEQKDLDKEITSNGPFFRLTRINTDDIQPDWTFEEENVLDKVTSLPQMDAYDGSLDALKAGVMMSYNQRLVAGSLSEKPHGVLPLATMVAREGDDEAGNALTGSVALQAFLKTLDGAYASDIITYANHVPRWLYHPDNDAKSYTLRVDDTTNKSITLEAHSALGGMYNYEGLGALTTIGGSSGLVPAVSSSSWREVLGEYRYTRAANPFTFPVGFGDKITDGTIRAFASAARPISEGQAGQFPLYVFASDGVWALSVGADGKFMAPASVQRDVLLEGTKPVNTDDSVLFLCPRGIVSLRGGSAKVLSLPLDGRQWRVPDISRELAAVYGEGGETLANAIASLSVGTLGDVLLYDYTHSRVYCGAPGHACWVLNLKSGVWTQSVLTLDDAVQGYPESLLVSGGKVCRMGDARATDWVTVTRPMSLRGGALQRLRQVSLQGLTPDTLAVVVRGTMDYRRTSIVSSVLGHRLSRLGGSPFRAHSLVLLAHGDGALTHIDIAHDGIAGDVME